MAFGNRDNIGGIPEQCFLLEKAQQILDGQGQLVRRPLSAIHTPILVPTLDPFSTQPGQRRRVDAANNPFSGSAPPELTPVRALSSDQSLTYATRGNIRSLNPGGAAAARFALTTNKRYLDFLTEVSNLDPAGHQKFLELTPHEISQMTHFLIIEETLTDQQNNTQSEPIFFDESNENKKNYQDFIDEDFYRASGQRAGAGVTNLTITHEGIDSVTKKVVKVDVSYLFQDIRTMLNSNYSKLFDQTQTQGTGGGARARSIDFTLGWDTNDELRQSFDDQGLNIDNLRLRVRTHMVSYTFDLNQNGSVSVNATYRGQIVDIASSPKSNILELAKQVFERYKEDLSALNKVAVRNAQSSQEAFVTQQTKGAVLLKTKLLLAKKLQESAANYEGDVNTMVEVVGPGGVSLGASAPTLIQGAIDVNKFKSSIFDTLRTDPALGGLDQNAVASESRRLEGIFDQYLGDTPKDQMKGTATISQAADLLRQLDSIDKRYETAEASLQTNVVDAVANAYAEQIRIANYQKFRALTLLAQQMIGSADLYHYVIDREEYPLAPDSSHRIDPFLSYKLALSENDTRTAANIIEGLQPNYFVNQLELPELMYQLLPTSAAPGAGAGPGVAENIQEDRFILNSFVFLGHLIESIFRLPTEMDYRTNTPGGRTVYELITGAGCDIRVDLGLLDFKRPLTGRLVQNFPLYYLPISYSLINEFFTREVVAKGREFYPLHDFIMDLLKKALPAGFNKCADVSGGQGTVPPKIQLTVGNRLETPGGRNVYQYFIYGSKSILQDLRGEGFRARNFGNYNQNMQQYIPHFFFYGRDKGIDQQIKLVDVTDPTIKQAAYYRGRSSKQAELSTSGLEKKTGIVPIVFNTQIKTIGYPFAAIGKYVYVDLAPLIIANSNSRMITATGYYNIHKVTHTFSREGFFTNLDGIIQLSAQSKDALDNPQIITPGQQGNARRLAAQASGAAAQQLAQIQQSVTQQTDAYRRLRDSIKNADVQANNFLEDIKSRAYDVNYIKKTTRKP